MGTNPDNDRNQGSAQRDQREAGDPDQQTDGQPSQSQQAGESRTGVVDWVTETFLRTAVAVLGLLLLLFALGQIAGFDTIGALADLLSTEVVQWTLVAVFALLLIVVASKNWNINTSN